MNDVTKWENSSRGCVQNRCNNETGEFTTVEACPEEPCSRGICNSETGVCSYENKTVPESLSEQVSLCYEIRCENDEWKLMKTSETSEWENQTNGCIDYVCDKGKQFNVICSSNSDETPICVNDKCITPRSIDETFVEIKIGASVTVTGLDENETLTALSTNVMSV